MEEQDLAAAHQSALSSFALSEGAGSMEHNLWHSHFYQDLLWQMVVVEDQPALAEVMQEEEWELSKNI